MEKSYQQKQNLYEPLKGIKVVEVAQGVAGPHCGKILAGLGAEVLKVEIPPDGDWSRKFGPMIPSKDDLESSALFLHNNTGKKSVVMDWTEKEGFVNLQNLINKSDILIEDWDLKDRKSLNISKDFFIKQNPKLIEMCVTAFGLSGPYSTYKSTPMILFALGGFMNIMGFPDKKPIMLPGFQADYVTGINANNAIQIALWERDSISNKGQFLELSMIETLVNLHQAPFEMDHGGNRQRMGHRQSALSAKGFPPGVSSVPAEDGYLTFGGGSQPIFETLCLMLGRPELIETEEFQNVFKNPESGVLMDKYMIDWMKGKTKQEVFIEVSTQWLLPVSPINTIRDILEDEQFNHKNAFQEIDHPMVGLAKYARLPFSINNKKLNIKRAPLLGENSNE